ncbi:MAG: MBL fold metallo-hydrolase [Mariprofundaceae bacterium]|nr:MBL fold metallo-hydrolase [Mariprofundaceae bacterium]
MADILFENAEHKCVFFEDFTTGEMISANQHMIVHQGKGILLDPGGHKVYPKIMEAFPEYLSPIGLESIFFSHQDPDIVASANGWLMVTDAKGYIPAIWRRFLAHFGVDGSNMSRVVDIPDKGMIIPLGDCNLKIIPAHFLHSSGNFHVYDPVSKILYTGDLGASMAEYRFVENFEDHVQYMIGFHQRYMGSSVACRLWVDMIRELDIETIAPQHGAIFQGKENVNKFLNWLEQLEVGPELMKDVFKIPS